MASGAGEHERRDRVERRHQQPGHREQHQRRRHGKGEPLDLRSFDLVGPPEALHQADDSGYRKDHEHRGRSLLHHPVPRSQRLDSERVLQPGAQPHRELAVSRGERGDHADHHDPDERGPRHGPPARRERLAVGEPERKQDGDRNGGCHPQPGLGPQGEACSGQRARFDHQAVQGVPAQRVLQPESDGDDQEEPSHWMAEASGGHQVADERARGDEDQERIRVGVGLRGPRQHHACHHREHGDDRGGPGRSPATRPLDRACGSRHLTEYVRQPRTRRSFPRCGVVAHLLRTPRRSSRPEGCR